VKIYERSPADRQPGLNQGSLEKTSPRRSGKSIYTPRAGCQITGSAGNQWVRKAIALRGTDPQMEFAAALMTSGGAREEHDRHLHNAMAGAKADAMLARNLASRFPNSAA
jgi:hypothetical protein